MKSVTLEGADKAHQAAMDEFRAVSRAHTQVTQDYRARKVGDKEFLASKAKFDAANKKSDETEAALRAVHDDPRPMLNAPTPKPPAPSPQLGLPLHGYAIKQAAPPTQQGARGGRFYLNNSGHKVYIK